MATSPVLTSWKEIAAYLGKGVRTVQRWEMELGMPVHRPGEDRHIVIAYPEELDQWVRRDPKEIEQDLSRTNGNRIDHVTASVLRQHHVSQQDKLQRMRELVKSMMEAAQRTRDNAAMVKETCQRAMNQRNGRSTGAAAN